MSSQPDDPTEVLISGPDITVIAYNISTTSIVYRLPSLERERLLCEYRTSFHAAAHNQSCQTSYDLGCQYLKNLHEVQQATLQANEDSDTNSIVSKDSGPPPLEDSAISNDSGPPLEPTSPSNSPVEIEVPASLDHQSSTPSSAANPEATEKWYAFWGKKVE
ncbi:hypothetical protein DFH07DRAFT_777890 [Mycena maculata]|uniref:Uncharacterized protein n=1 Tax=Mycena maculata TaxID=230809 RepID=A0AAD7IGV6_9AGAR|nr:hypothetical protein DFH07DRAFT_777890 [Mycena maculata]